MVLFLPAKLESTDILLLLLWEILFHISGKRLEHFKIKGKILESGSRKRSPPLGYLNNGCKAGFGFCIAQEETLITRKENIESNLMIEVMTNLFSHVKGPFE